MSTKDYSAELLKMEGVQIEKLDETEEEILLQISMERKMHICKRCGGKTDRIHDYRVREVRDLELRGKPVRLLYRRRRYACPACGKRFSETNDFVGRSMRFTHRTAEKIMELLRRRSSMKDIAKGHGDLRQRRETHARHHARLQAAAIAAGHLPLTNSRATRAASPFSASSQTL